MRLKVDNYDKCYAVIEVDVGEDAVVHILDSVEPENRITPPWVNVSCRARDAVLECKISVDDCSDPRRILTLRNTIDDLLQAISTALNVLKGIN